MAEVKRKYHMRPLLRAGVFGLTMEMWDTPAEVLASGHPGPFWICQSRRYSGPCTFHVTRETLEEAYAKYLRKVSAEYTQICAECPTEDQTLTAQVARIYLGLILTYSREKANQREAFNNGCETCEGREAVALIRSLMDPSSYDDLMELLDTYPDAVVEFHCFSRPVGPGGRNTFFGEVRNY